MPHKKTLSKKRNDVSSSEQITSSLSISSIVKHIPLKTIALLSLFGKAVGEKYYGYFPDNPEATFRLEYYIDEFYDFGMQLVNQCGVQLNSAFKNYFYTSSQSHPTCQFGETIGPNVWLDIRSNQALSEEAWTCFRNVFNTYCNDFSNPQHTEWNQLQSETIVTTTTETIITNPYGDDTSTAYFFIKSIGLCLAFLALIKLCDECNKYESSLSASRTATPVIYNDPSVYVKRKPVVVHNDPPVYIDRRPVVVHNDPPVYIDRTPVVVHNDPPVYIDRRPVVVHNSPPQTTVTTHTVQNRFFTTPHHSSSNHQTPTTGSVMMAADDLKKLGRERPRPGQ